MKYYIEENISGNNNLAFRVYNAMVEGDGRVLVSYEIYQDGRAVKYEPSYPAVGSVYPISYAFDDEDIEEMAKESVSIREISQKDFDAAVSRLILGEIKFV